MPLLETTGSSSSRGFGQFGSIAFPFDINGIRTTNLQLALGPGGGSYNPSSPSDWKDVSGNNNHFKIVPAAYSIDTNATKTPYFNFRGSYGIAKTASGLDVPGWSDTTPATMITFTRLLTPTPSNWRTLARTRENDGTVGNATRHNVIIQNNGDIMGMYNNNNLTAPSPGGFVSNTYNVSSIPGYGTSTWFMGIWRYADSSGQYYNFSYNDTPGTIRTSINERAALFMKGPLAIGGYHGGGSLENYSNPAVGDQFWGDISSFFLWNARLSDAECLTVFNKYRGFYGL